MDIFLTTLESVAVLLGLGLLGFWVVSRRVIPENAFDILTPLAIDIALPCLIFANIIDGFDPAASPDWWTLPLWWAGFMVFAGTLTACLTPLAGKGLRREFALALFFRNAIFVPLAVLTGMFGTGSPRIIDLFLFTLFFPSLFFGSYHLFFASGKRRLEWRRVLNIVLIATAAAVAMKLSGTHRLLPDFALQAARMMGAATIPVLMLILGGSVYVDFKHGEKLYTAEILKFVCAKNILFPLAALGLLLLIKPSRELALLLLLESAVPPVTAVPVVAARMGGNRNAANQFLVASFAASLVTIPVAMALFAAFF